MRARSLSPESKKSRKVPQNVWKTEKKPSRKLFETQHDFINYEQFVEIIVFF